MNAFELAIDLNLRTVLLTTEAAIPEMRARGGGSLLFTASTSGLQGSSFSPVYSMCKFGVVGFVKSLSVRLAPEKIRVNAICPGPIDTPMLRVFVARPDQKSTAGMDPEELVRQRAGRSVPLGRTGRPEEIANAALFHVPTRELPRVLGELARALKPRGVLFSSNPRGANEEGWSGGRYGAWWDLETWRRHLAAAGFTELVHYYRPEGRPRAEQPWLASAWRRQG